MEGKDRLDGRKASMEGEQKTKKKTDEERHPKGEV